jgi:hypothetical protein
MLSAEVVLIHPLVVTSPTLPVPTRVQSLIRRSCGLSLWFYVTTLSVSRLCSVKGSGRGLIIAQSQYSSWGTDENHALPQSGIADVLLEIRTEYWLNTRLKHYRCTNQFDLSVMSLCDLVDGYRRFGSVYCLQVQNCSWSRRPYVPPNYYYTLPDCRVSQSSMVYTPAARTRDWRAQHRTRFKRAASAATEQLPV